MTEDKEKLVEKVAQEIERYGESLVPELRIVCVWLASHFRDDEVRAALEAIATPEPVAPVSDMVERGAKAILKVGIPGGSAFDAAERREMAEKFARAVLASIRTPEAALVEALDDDGLSGMWKARALRLAEAMEKLESYCFGLETQTRGFRPESIRELFALAQFRASEHGER